MDLKTFRCSTPSSVSSYERKSRFSERLYQYNFHYINFTLTSDHEASVIHIEWLDVMCAILKPQTICGQKEEEEEEEEERKIKIEREREKGRERERKGEREKERERKRERKREKGREGGREGGGGTVVETFSQDFLLEAFNFALTKLVLLSLIPQQNVYPD